MMRKFAKAAVVASLALAIAVPALAQTTGGTSTVTGDTMMMKKTVDLACVASAVDKREAAIAAGWDTFSAAAKSAYSTRRSALAAAWAMTDAKARGAAVKAAWKAWDSAVKSARMDWRTAKQAAWKQFAADRKACHGTTEDAGGAAHDSQL